MEIACNVIGSWKSDGLHLALNVGYEYGLWIARCADFYLTFLFYQHFPHTIASPIFFHAKYAFATIRAENKINLLDVQKPPAHVSHHAVI